MNDMCAWPGSVTRATIIRASLVGLRQRVPAADRQWVAMAEDQSVAMCCSMLFGMSN